VLTLPDSGTGGAFDEWTHVVNSSGAAIRDDTAVLPQVARFTRVCAYEAPTFPPASSGAWDAFSSGKEAITRGGATQRKTVPRHAEAVGLFLNLSLVPEVWQQLL